MLGRPIVDVGVEAFAGYLAGATVLVTGAGGSLGAELCVRLVQLGARELVLVDQAEAGLVALAESLRREQGAQAVPVLADVTRAGRASEVFERHRPDVVFHAAAYKHVPLLEEHPVEAVSANVLGTRCVVDAARRVGVGRFVLFSTDKAVEPESVLGRTKAVAEWIVAAAAREASQGRYAAVRLGNVIDSAGSVLPIFRRQIADGGPVTVTHPHATRYVLTSGEAADLAIVAGALADSASIFWLDAGPPVRIVELARRLAAAVSTEIAIDFVGLRPGERLHEQMLWSGDEVVPTPCAHVHTSPLRQVESGWLDEWTATLAGHVDRVSAAGVRATLANARGLRAGGAASGGGRAMTFVLSFDFEDWHQLVLRRIGRADWRDGSAEFEQHLASLLALLDELRVSATFFVAGVTADRHPQALRDVVAQGHEVACHGYEHRRAFRQGPDAFRDDLVRCVDAIERIVGVTPVGYRAPWFSITRDSLWAHDILRELGFRYDSSLFDSPRIPARITPVPAHPFRIDGSELWEFPVASWRRGRLVLPVGGGAYWRLLPSRLLWHGLEQVTRASAFPVLYFHPYEFATEPLRIRLPAGASPRERWRETSRRISKNARRHLIPVRLREAADRFRLVPFRDVLVAACDDSDPTVLRPARAGV